MTRRIVAVTFALLVLLTTEVAAAHPEVDDGKELLMEAEFEQALEAFARAEASDDLTREDLITLLGARCLAHLAMDDAGALRQDLRRLASIAPDHRWGREAPPELGEAFAQTLEVVEGELSVTGSAEPVSGGIAFTGEARADPGGLVREIRIFTRLGDGAWRRRSSGGTQAVPAGQSLDYYVEAIGPGGATLATDGSREEPLTSDAALAGASLVRQRDDDDGGGISPWVWIGIGAGVLVAAGVVVAILLLGNTEPDGTQPESPLVIGF